uniref:Costars domain-containing protein n=1 Tax=Lepeophtheirus salmonis TaxID=72036 RepID=A0A0K2TXK3_LEPSM
MPGYDVEGEINNLVGFIKSLGSKSEGGDRKIEVKFKTLFEDDEVSNSLESLAGTLKAAKKKKVVSYESELLLQGVSDDVVITLL